MEIDERRFAMLAHDATEISCFRWEGGVEIPKAVIQIAHGAGEHSRRYLEPLTPLIEAGYIVYSADHRGHGATAQRPGGALGDFGPGGAADAVMDMAFLSSLIREDEAGLPLILLGHSMGAMFAQAFILDHSELIDILVLSGTAGGPNDPDAPPPRPAPRDGFEGRTPYDWLSRDPAEVDRYIADPLCGIRFTPESSASLARLRERIGDPDALADVRSSLPVYVFVGDQDPINAGLTRIHPLIRMYEDAGLTDVTLKVYPGGRHEMLNETNRDEVVADLKAWLDDRVLRLSV
jgi:alpha-beta hydrolase superfamily lysophospholipase